MKKLTVNINRCGPCSYFRETINWGVSKGHFCHHPDRKCPVEIGERNPGYKMMDDCPLPDVKEKE